MFLEIHHLNALIRDLDEYFHMQIRHLENKKKEQLLNICLVYNLFALWKFTRNFDLLKVRFT